MRIFAILLLLIGSLLFAASNATYLKIIGPVNANLTDNQTVYLGIVGPGESFYVLAGANSTSPNGNFINLAWNQLEAVNLPQGWSAQKSPLYENPMKMKITVAPNAQYGRYTLELRSVNTGNYAGIGNLTFFAAVNVTPDVFSVAVISKTLKAGLGQPATVYLTINNTGISDDPFVVSASGLPAWNYSDEVVSLHATKNTFSYPVFLNEPGVYKFNLTVASSTSPLIRKAFPMTLTVKASLLNDYESLGNGVGLSPIIFEPAYAFMSLLAYLYTALIH